MTLASRKIITLSGWGQPHDSLRLALPEARHFDYSHHESPEHIFAALAEHARDADLVVGWSLGGQLLVRAAAAGIIRPKRMALIAAPYQFVESTLPGLGMKRSTFELFRSNLQTNMPRTLRKSWALVATADAKEEQVAQLLAELGVDMPSRDWLKWLDALSHFSCEALDLSCLPPTLLVHGMRDAVVGVNQSELFARKIPQATLELWHESAHAPHLHDPVRLRQLLEVHVG